MNYDLFMLICHLISAIFATVVSGGCIIWLISGWVTTACDTAPKLSDRDVEIDKQLSCLKKAMQIKHRCDRKMVQKCRRLETRIKLLERGRV